MLKFVGLYVLTFLVVFFLPFRWWQVRPTLQPGTLIGRLLPWLDTSLRNLAIRALVLLFLFTVGLYAVLMTMLLVVPLMTTVFLAWHLLARLFNPKYVPPIHTPGIILITVALYVAVLAMVAPVEVGLIGAYFALGEPAGGFLEDISVGPDTRWVNAVVGLAGVIFVVFWLVRDLLWRLRQAADLRNLPTSRVRSAALGLVELKGVAQPVDGGSGPILRLHWDGASYLQPKQELKRFYLVDGTGRILVDPTECQIRAGWITDFGSVAGCYEVTLTRRVEKDDRSDGVTRTLMPGDPVYVIGNAEVDEKAPRDAVDSERLVIRPSRLSHWSLSLWRFLFADLNAPPSESKFNVFFVSDGGELRARRQIMKGLRTVWLVALVWLATSLFLLWCARDPYPVNPESWRAAHWTQPPPRAGFYDERYARFQKWVRALRPTSFDAIPALFEALRYPDYRYKAGAASGFRRMLPAAREQAKDAVPLLREMLQYKGEHSQVTIETLGLFGPLAAPAVPDLAEILRTRDPDPLRRFFAAEALGKLGETARPAVPALREALQDRSRGVREAAQRALARIEPSAIPKDR